MELARWAISNNASNAEVDDKFGYLGKTQIFEWKKSIAKKDQMGYCLLQKNKYKVNKNDRCKKENKRTKKQLTPERNRIEILEAENLKLKIKLEVSKLLASMKQQTDKSQK